ncbi:MAG: hypothetical protein HYZ73_03090 [Elusimicrobia bacterium]|nr:hypothetical protein [Elusimicrobiota bacterium]
MAQNRGPLGPEPNSWNPAQRPPAAASPPPGRPSAWLSLGVIASLFLSSLGATLPWAAKEEKDCGSPAPTILTLFHPVGYPLLRVGVTRMEAATWEECLLPVFVAGGGRFGLFC